MGNQRLSRILGDKFALSLYAGGDFKDQFVDRLMKTYTSEAVFLLTTLVNMARARPADSEQERDFICTIVLEIFEVCRF